MKEYGLKISKYSLLGFPVWIYIFFAFLIVVRMWLVNAQRLFAVGGNIHDDMLFLNLTNELIQGNWLGTYNQLTMVKGPFYPLWIAAVHKINIPLLLAQHLFYASACFVFVISIKPLFPNNSIPLILFFILLFNPVSYADGPMTRVLREGIYPSLTLLIVSGAIGFFIRIGSSREKLIPWSITLGISMAAFWLTREEGVWIIPFMLWVMGLSLLKIWHETRVEWLKVFLCLLPFIIWLISIGSIATLNHIYYGVFLTVEFKSPEFLAAYGSLTRVKHKNWLPTYPVPSETRERIFEVSPAFAELRVHFETDIGGWASNVNTIRKAMEDPTINNKIQKYLKNDLSGIWEEVLSSNRHELLGGDFLWTLRYAVAANGHHTSGKSAANYYAKLAKEVNQACDNGKLACFSERASLMPPYHTAYTVPFLKTFVSSFVFLSTFEDVTSNPSPSVGSEESLERFRYLTRERLAINSSDAYSHQDEFKLRTLNGIIDFYKRLTPIMFFFSLILYGVSTVYILRSRILSTLWFINTATFMSIIVRSVILSLVHITSFPAINILYLAPSYPLLLIFSVMVTVSFHRTHIPHPYNS